MFVIWSIRRTMLRNITNMCNVVFFNFISKVKIIGYSCIDNVIVVTRRKNSMKRMMDWGGVTSRKIIEPAKDIITPWAIIFNILFKLTI